MDLHHSKLQRIRVSLDKRAMTTIEEARAKVVEVLDQVSERIKIDLAIAEHATRVEPWCWVFFYTSRTYVETGDLSDASVGNGPIVVEKDTGAVHELTTARPVDEQLQELRDRGRNSTGRT